MDDRMTLIKAIIGGAALPTLVVGIAATAPLVNDQFITPVDGRVLAIAWWFLVPLGITVAVIRSRRMWPGTVVAVWSLLGYHVSMVLLLDAADRAEALWSGAGWLGTLFAMLMPCAVGLAFGWSSLQGKPRRLDGVPASQIRDSER